MRGSDWLMLLAAACAAAHVGVGCTCALDSGSSGQAACKRVQQAGSGTNDERACMQLQRRARPCICGAHPRTGHVLLPVLLLL